MGRLPDQVVGGMVASRHCITRYWDQSRGHLCPLISYRSGGLLLSCYNDFPGLEEIETLATICCNRQERIAERATALPHSRSRRVVRSVCRDHPCVGQRPISMPMSDLSRWRDRSATCSRVARRCSNQASAAFRTWTSGSSGSSWVPEDSNRGARRLNEAGPASRLRRLTLARIKGTSRLLPAKFRACSELSVERN